MMFRRFILKITWILKLYNSLTLSRLSERMMFGTYEMINSIPFEKSVKYDSLNLLKLIKTF